VAQVMVDILLWFSDYPTACCSCLWRKVGPLPTAALTETIRYSFF
jgi:hypothetical protein